MSVKYTCNRCGKEIGETAYMIEINRTDKVDCEIPLGSPYGCFKNRFFSDKHFCDDCIERIKEFSTENKKAFE